MSLGVTPGGRALAARRAFLGMSQLDIEAKTNGIIYQRLLSRIERGVKGLMTLKLGEYTALLDALELDSG